MVDSEPKSADASSADPSGELDLTGRQLGDYDVIRRLGRGGMADVYLAQQRSLRRQVALKVLKNSLANDETYVRRFHNEAQAAASLVHAAIVQIYEVGCIAGLHFIAQEYVAGQNLKQFLSRHGPMEVPQAASIMRQVASALHKASQRGIVHRDIKPENIMLSAQGEVKVADFGLARVSTDGKAVDLTQVGMTMGTPLYMSPEQVEGGKIDPRSDLYSLGVTCYQMLAGRPPFEGDTALSIAVQHLKKEPQRLESCRADLPSGLCRMVHRMLAKQPRDRYQCAADLLADLRALRIEGLDDHWPAAGELWGTAELVQPADGRLQATQQLDAVMKTESRQRRTPGRLRWLVAVLIAAFALGGWLAYLTRPISLLHVDVDQLPKIEKMDSAHDQYVHATLLGTEQALRSVEQYFPGKDNRQNEYYVSLSKQRLAELYLSKDSLDEAMRLFVELSNVAETEAQFRAFGLTGQAIVHARREEKQLVAQKLTRAMPEIRKLSPALRASLLQQLGPQLRGQVERLLRESREGNGGRRALPGRPAGKASLRGR